jgi:putative DNA primase/helicase
MTTPAPPSGPPSTEQAFLELFAARYHDIVHCLGQFWRYGDGQWREVPLDAIHAELVTIIEGAHPADSSAARRLIATMPDSLRTYGAVPVEIWNSDGNPRLPHGDPARLPCRNGILTLATGRLEPHAATLYLLRTLGVNYEPAARAPVWEAFLAGTVPSAARFLQEFAGLCLTFDTRHETAVWLTGPPGSGKSTFLRGLEVLLGERAGVLDLAALDRGRLSAAFLLGRSVLLSNEQPVADLKHDHLLNALISGEPIPIQRSRQLPATASLRLSAKWVWALTHLPRLAYAGSGLFRRVRIVTFPPRALADRDPALKARLAQEGPGLLNWALAGLARLQKRGRFQSAPAIQAAGETFHHANDLVAQFVADQAQRQPDGSIQGSQLYSAYSAWCRQNGHPPLSGNGVAAEWERLGFQRRRVHGLSYWHGLQLNPSRPTISGEQPATPPAQKQKN